MITNAEWIVLFGMFFSFASVIILIRKRVNFGISLLFGSLLLAIFSLSSTTIESVFYAFLRATIYDVNSNVFVFNTIELAILMTLIFMLASLMQDTKGINHLIESLRSVFSKGGTIAIIPAVYGLMPVPGGALFSAPAVEAEGKTFSLSISNKNFFNVWFRHIWFPIYPISSSILIMADIASVDLFLLIMVNSVSFVSMIIVGFVMLALKTGAFKSYISKDKKESNKKTNHRKKNISGLLFLIPPILPLGFSIFKSVGLSLFTSFSIGVIASIILLFFMSKVSWEEYKIFLKQALTWKLIAVIAGIMIFREIFEVSGVNITIYSILEQLPITPLVVIILFPLTLGLLTGYLLSGITLSYVLLQPLFTTLGINEVGLVSILFMSGFIGYLISPIHLCNVLSSEYLKTDTTRMYPLYIPSSIIVLITQIVFVIFFLN